MIRIEPPYWRLQGWQRVVFGYSPGYRGYYRTPYGSYSGEIRGEDGEGLYYFILNPPKQLRDHRHWVCFTYQGRGRYHVHFTKKPKDIDSGIVEMERLIRESFEGSERR